MSRAQYFVALLACSTCLLVLPASAFRTKARARKSASAAPGKIFKYEPEPEQSLPNQTRAQPGLWITVTHELKTSHKEALVSEKVEKELQSSWAEGWLLSAMKYTGVTQLIAGQVGELEFMLGLKNELRTQILEQLASKGVVGAIAQGYMKVTEKTLTFLIMVLDINQEKFSKNNMDLVRDGVADQLAGDTEGMPSLAETLGECAVPDAHVEVSKSGEDSVVIKVLAQKSKILGLNMPAELKKAGLPDALANSAGIQALIRAVGYRGTRSADIAAAMCITVVDKMTEELKGNGIIADVTAVPWKKHNGKKNVEGQKMIGIDVLVNIKSINGEAFANSQIVIVRDSVHIQLAGDSKGAGGLRDQLAAKNFPAEVRPIKCGWTGAFPPKVDKYPDCIGADLLKEVGVEQQFYAM